MTEVLERQSACLNPSARLGGGGFPNSPGPSAGATPEVPLWGANLSPAGVMSPDSLVPTAAAGRARLFVLTKTK